MVTSNMIVDFLYGLLDPRLRARERTHDGATLKDAASPPPQPAARSRSRSRSLGWIAAMLVIAALRRADRALRLSPQLDLRDRLRRRPASRRTGWAPTSSAATCCRGCIVSIRITLLIAFVATVISAIVGTALGFVAAHFRGHVEQLILMLIDFQASMPFLIIALAVLAFFGNSLPLLVCLMGLYGWERYARIARGLAISANAQGYAAAVRQLGATPARIYRRHILPNIASTLIVSTTLVFPEMILLKSGLSFLGLGVQPPMTSLGNMVGYGREYITRASWIMLAPARDHHADHAGGLRHRRLAARSARSRRCNGWSRISGFLPRPSANWPTGPSTWNSSPVIFANRSILVVPIAQPPSPISVAAR